jgi:hypothetical protein
LAAANGEEYVEEKLAEGERPFRFSLFGRLAYEIKQNHLEYLGNANDSDVLIFLLYTYILNHSKDVDTMNLILNNLIKNVNESELTLMHENRSGTLSKVLKFFIMNYQRDDLKEYEKMVTKVYLSKYTKKTRRNDQNIEGQPGHTISRENIFVREALKDVL